MPTATKHKGVQQKEQTEKNEENIPPEERNEIPDGDLNLVKKRILDVLEENVRRLKLVACLPTLLARDGKLLKMFFMKEEDKGRLYFIIEAFSKFDPDSNRISQWKETPKEVVDIIEKIKWSRATAMEFPSLANPGVDPVLSKAIDYLVHNDCLVRGVDEMIQKINFNENARVLIKCMEVILQIATDSFARSAQEERKRSTKLQRALMENMDTKAEIEKVKGSLKKLEEYLNDNVGIKQTLLEDLLRKRDNLIQNYNGKILTVVRAYETKMMEETHSKMNEAEELKQKAQRVKAEYLNFLKNNMTNESNLRSKCNKVEAQVLSWISKYDQDVGEKRLDLEALQEKLDSVKAESDKVEEMIKKIQRKYNRFKAEEEVEERQRFNEMSHQFLLNRSAAKIQRFWRVYCLMKKEKKKGKGGKRK